jgi:immune inhibitor A
MRHESFLSIGIGLALVLTLQAPVLAIEPPSDEEAELLRTAPDLQERIDRMNRLLEPLLNPPSIQPVDVARDFAEGVSRYFGRTPADERFYPRYDLNEDQVIDERDFVELAFEAPALIRQACKSPTHGEAHCAVLPIKFPDVPPSPSHHSDYWSNMFFGEGTYTTHSYYRQVSDGALDLGGAVLTNPGESDGYWMADFPKTTYDWDTDLLGEILDKADPYYDFSDYDADGNDEADGVFFIYAGDTDGWGDFYWGWATYGGYVVDGVRVGPLMFVGEHLMTYRVAAHEFGHMMGLPDYYDYTFKSNGIGVWGLMGKGEAYMCARARTQLGWVDPIALSLDTYDVHFTPRSENGDVYRLWHMGEYGAEYFLLEWVTHTGYDYQMPGEGLLIWHIDETMSDNDDWEHKQNDLEEADGRDDIDTKANNGDDTDPYYAGNNDTFNHDSYPNSDSYSSGATAVQVLNVSALSVMMADLIVGVPGNLETDEIEPNDAWDDSGVIDVPDPNGIPDGRVDYYQDPSDFWRVTVGKPAVIDVTLDSYMDGVNLSLTLWGLGGGGPIEVTDTTYADEHLRAYVFIPGNHFIEVRAERQAAYYDLHVEMELLPDPGEIALKGVPLLADTVYDNTLTMPAMRIDILNNAGWVNLQSLQLYTQGSYPSFIEGVELWLDNGDEIFGPGLDTLVAGPIPQGLTNRIQIGGLDVPISGYTALFLTVDLGDSGGGGQAGVTVMSYKDVVFSSGSVVYPNFPLESGVANAISAPTPLCYVAAGDFWMGSDPESDPYYDPACDYNEETPPHWNRTGDFYIGRYEITCAQFAEFMADGGYTTQSYWAGGGWDWKNSNGITQPNYWNDGEHFIGDAFPDYPVGGLSWYEALAYCDYVGGRLPREPEWEKSGRTTDGRIYTYGDVYNPAICALGDPEPVGSYPASDSLYGVADLCGNIFEWTLDSWQWGLYERYKDGIFDPPTSNSYKMQRSYRYLVVGDCDQDYATRLSYRDTWPRTYRWTVNGFRPAFDPLS